MKHSLAKRLRYLEDEEVAKAIVNETCEIPSGLDEATPLILQEIGKMGNEMRNGEGHEIVFSTEDYRIFWKRVSK